MRVAIGWQMCLTTGNPRCPTEGAATALLSGCIARIALPPCASCCKSPNRLNEIMDNALSKVPWGVAQYWAHYIEQAQAPNGMSSRDGRLLKMLPREQRLHPDELKHHLQAALAASPQLARNSREAVLACWLHNKPPGKAVLALMRGRAYLAAGNADIALKVPLRTVELDLLHSCM